MGSELGRNPPCRNTELRYEFRPAGRKISLTSQSSSASRHRGPARTGSGPSTRPMPCSAALPRQPHRMARAPRLCPRARITSAASLLLFVLLFSLLDPYRHVARPGRRPHACAPVGALSDVAVAVPALSQASFIAARQAVSSRGAVVLPGVCNAVCVAPRLVVCPIPGDGRRGRIVLSAGMGEFSINTFTSMACAQVIANLLR